MSIFSTILTNLIINLSALARLILPEVRRLTYKGVKAGAVLMALKRQPKTRKYFLTVTQGTFETTVIVASELKDIVETILGADEIIFKLDGLSSITINLPGKTALTPGVYYSILKILAWEGINIVEVVSTFSEFIIILEEKNRARAKSKNVKKIFLRGRPPSLAAGGGSVFRPKKVRANVMIRSKYGLK